MKRVLSSIGIGGATVDTVFPRAELRPGETVTADVELYGGDSAQDIERISLDLKAQSEGGGGGKRTVRTVTVDEGLTLDPDEERTIPVDVHVPAWTPLTRNGTSVWVETTMEIDWARDPTDEDRIDVVPGEYAAALFEGVEELGFALRGSELVETPYLDDRPFAQEFDFRPTDGQYARDLDELAITFVPREDDLRVFVEFDEADEVAEEYDMDFDEQEVSITLDRADTDMMRRRIKNAIDQYT